MQLPTIILQESKLLVVSWSMRVGFEFVKGVSLSPGVSLHTAVMEDRKQHAAASSDPAGI